MVSNGSMQIETSATKLKKAAFSVAYVDKEYVDMCYVNVYL